MNGVEAEGRLVARDWEKKGGWEHWVQDGNETNEQTKKKKSFKNIIL